VVRLLGLSQICSKICPKCFQEFPKNFTCYASQCSCYACIMLLSCQQFLALSWKIQSTDCSIRVFHFSLQGDCTIREYRSKELCAMHLSTYFQFEHFTDCSIRQYWSVLDELSSVYSETFIYYASIILWPIMLFIIC